jgi:hypothetical protein
MSSSRVGSVFLGDLQRVRHLSSPPSSPPSSITGALAPSLAFESTDNIDMESPSVHPGEQQSTPTAPFPAPPTKIDPVLALELRLRWLEALILGVRQDLGKDRKGKVKEDCSTAAAIANLKHGETLSRLAETVQQKLDKAVQGNEGLTKFMNQCMFLSLSSFLSLKTFVLVYLYVTDLSFFLGIDDKHAPLLMPSFVLSDSVPDPPTYDKMSAEELDAFLTEMEPEIRSADRDMLEVEALEKRGVTGAGRLLGIRINSFFVLFDLKMLGFQITRSCSHVSKQY